MAGVVAVVLVTGVVVAVLLAAVVPWAALPPADPPIVDPPVPPSTPSIPSAPRNLAASPGDATVVLGWMGPLSDGGSAVTNYRIYRGASSGGTTLLTTVGTVPAYTDAGLTNGVTYSYEVAAVNAVGEGPRSAEASATPSPWTNLVADGTPGSPPTRNGHTAVYDAAANRMIVFGGRVLGFAIAYYNDLWVLANANGLGGKPTWTNLIADGDPRSPPERAYHTAVYDAAENRMIVFGGRGGTLDTALGDVWVLAHANGLP